MESVEYIETVVKPSAEKRPFSVDFTDRLPEGATLSSCTVASISAFTGETASSVISGASATIDGNKATIYLQAGTAGQRYKITYTATLSDGSILPEYVLLIVDDTPE